MNLLEDMSKVAYVSAYSGPRDDEGRPHGCGTMEYSTKTAKKFRYEGHFVHGVRSGYGVLSELTRLIREYEAWEWAQMGDYDSAGRLIRPNTKSGPYKESTDSWDVRFRGWWKDDEAVCDFKWWISSEIEFGLSEDEAFLNRFIDYRDVRKLSERMVSKLSRSGGVYEKYGYAVWLWSTRKDSLSLKKAFENFKEAASAGVADALHMISRMYYLGKAYDEQSDRFVLDHELSKEYASQAVERGSLLARLMRNRDTFWGSYGSAANREEAIEEARREASLPGASIYWTELLGSYYRAEQMENEAVGAYEKCMICGNYMPIYDLALIYLEKKEVEYYEVLMELGMRLGVPECNVLGIEREHEWESLDDDERCMLHRRLDDNLHEGLSQGSSLCAYLLADFHVNAKMGFDFDLKLARKYAGKGIDFGDSMSMALLIETAEILQDDGFMTEDELLKLRLESLRYGLDSQLDHVINNRDSYLDLGYGDEIDAVWMPLWKEAR